MSIFYVCATYDEYDPVTGIFSMVQDCIEWDTDILGDPGGRTTYSTKAQCYEQSECINPISNNPNNWCDIRISSASIIDRNNNDIIIQVILPQQYCHTHMEYALYDIENNLLKDWTKVITQSKHLNAIDTYTIDISLSGSGSGSGSGEEICVLALRLVQPCLGSGSGGERTLVPIEDAGGMGSAGAHWENNPRLASYPCSDGFDYVGISDIMNAIISTSTITNISISFLEDIGYARTPGIIFDRCSWQNVESTIIEDVQEVFEAAAVRWESYISYDPSVFATISSQQNNPGDDDSSGGDGGDGGGSGGGGSEGNGGSEEESGGSGSGSGSGSGCGDYWNGLKLNGFFESYSEENWAAMCTVDESITLGPVQINAISYSIVINSRFNNLSASQWTSIMTHELGHALGIGTLWQADIPECFWLTNDKYPKTSEAYNDMYYSNTGPCDETLVPQLRSIQASNQDSGLSGLEFHCGCGKHSIIK